jgi:hypothetical protein
MSLSLLLLDSNSSVPCLVSQYAGTDVFWMNISFHSTQLKTIVSPASKPH